jgi:hypothetical protein
MADLITEQEYTAEIRNIAQKQLPEEFREAGDDTDPDEFISERLHEIIDGHKWIIYTYYNSQVLTHTDNDGAYFDDMGDLAADNYSAAVMPMAFYAMRQDVVDRIRPSDFD